MNFVFVDKKNVIELHTPNPSELLDHIPPKIYRIGVTQTGLVLEVLKMKFDLPEKIFGEHHSRLKLIVDDYRASSRGSSALLTGVKGTGKTLLAEAIANKLLEQGVPVLLIERNLPAGILKDVITAMGPVVVMFDEFGKNFPEESNEKCSQEDLLTLFSDSSLKKVLFLVLENNTAISAFLKDRPGRIKYSLTFGLPGMTEFTEICEGYPIHENIFGYFKQYFHSTNGRGYSDYGLDTLLLLRDTAVNVTDTRVLVDKIKVLNVPDPIGFRYHLFRIIDRAEKVVVSAKLDSADNNGNVAFRFLNADFDTVGKVAFNVAELTPLSESPYNKEFRFVADDRFVLLFRLFTVNYTDTLYGWDVTKNPSDCAVKDLVADELVRELGEDYVNDLMGKEKEASTLVVNALHHVLDLGREVKPLPPIPANQGLLRSKHMPLDSTGPSKDFN